MAKHCQNIANKMTSFLEFIPYYTNNINNFKITDIKLTDMLNIIDGIDCINNNFNMYWEYYLIMAITLLSVYIISLLFKLDFNASRNPNPNKQIVNLNGNGNGNGNANTNTNTKSQTDNLYFQSILEVLSKNNEIVDKLEKNTDYWILLRVVMKHPLKMKRTKYELHGNNVDNIGNRAFNTQDMYIIIKLRFYDYEFMNGNVKFSMANTIVRCMNHLNQISPEEYKTKDFIVVAISTKPIVNNNTNTNTNTNNNSNSNGNEFYNGLINNNYELYNFKEMNIKINGKNDDTHYIGYIMMLPIHEIYDIFMDVYNTTLFETVKYAIDDNNYESWNNVSINELKF